MNVDKKRLHQEFILMMHKEAEKEYPDRYEYQTSFMFGYLDSFLLTLMDDENVKRIVQDRVEWSKKQEVLELKAGE